MEDSTTLECLSRTIVKMGDADLAYGLSLTITNNASLSKLWHCVCLMAEHRFVGGFIISIISGSSASVSIPELQ